MTLETLIAFLTIEINNMDNYIVTFEKRVMVTAFAILAMFDQRSTILPTPKMVSCSLSASSTQKYINQQWV